ncbi:MAG: cell division protein FtsL [Gammaproteobacteria bacterium]
MLTRLNVLLAGLLVVFSLGLVTSQHRARELFIAVERAQAHAVAHEVRWNQLQVEQTELAKAALIDTRARRELGMQSVASDRILHLSVDPVTHTVSLSQPWREGTARPRAGARASTRTSGVRQGVPAASRNRPTGQGATTIRASVRPPATALPRHPAPAGRSPMEVQP